MREVEGHPFSLTFFFKVHPMTEPTIRKIALRIGETLNVRLEGNPSTGYDWDAAASDEDSLSRVAIRDLGADHHSESAPPNAPRLVGAPVMRAWSVTAVLLGTARLIFNYRRPWETAGPIKTHIVILDITE